MLLELSDEDRLCCCLLDTGEYTGLLQCLRVPTNANHQVLKKGIPNVAYQETLVAALKDTTSTLESCSIDAAHPAFRYSILLRDFLNQLSRMERPPILSPFALTISAREPRNRVDDEISSNMATSNLIPSQDRQ